MARSRRAKSQSVSSASGIVDTAATLNGIMPPPSPPTTTASTPKVARQRKASTTAPTTSPRDREPVVTTPAPKKAMETPAVPVGTPSIPPRRPGVAQYLIIAGVSSLLEAFLQSIASQFGTGDLAAISKHSESWTEVGGLLAWKLATLAVYWFGGFDAYDVASLTLLLRTPLLLLLTFFYMIRPLTLATTTVSTLIATTAPFFIFRPISPIHAPKAHPHAPRSLLRNRSILTDQYTTISTTVLSAAIFTVVLELSFQTFLPVHLVTNFEGIRSLEFIHLGPAGLPILLLVLLPAGYACTEFLFAPSTGATELTSLSPTPTAAAAVYTFDTTTATLGQHVYHNAWGWYNARQKALIGRGLVLGLLITAETVIGCVVGLAGVDLPGALGYAAIWGTAVTVTGLVLDWVGGPSD